LLLSLLVVVVMVVVNTMTTATTTMTRGCGKDKNYAAVSRTFEDSEW
jgi:predicted small secreted protein